MICKFGSFNNLFATIASLPELYFKFRKFIVGTNKKVTSMNYGSIKSSWKPQKWVRLDLTFMMRDWTHSQNLLAANALKHLQNDHRNCPNHHKNSHKLYNKTGHPVLSWWKVNGNCDNDMIRISQWRKAIENKY